MPDPNDLSPRSSLDGNLNPHIRNVAIKNGQIRKVETRPVVSGQTTVRKKNVVERLDIPGIVSDAVIDKILPDLRDIAFDSITSVLSNVFYGDDRMAGRRGYSSQPTSYRQSNYRSYSRPYRSYDVPFDEDPYAHPTGVYDPDDILFSNKEDAKNVYYAIGNIISNYGQASVADLYDAANLSNINVSDKYGWKDISDSKIRMVRDGYILVLPRPIRLD